MIRNSISARGLDGLVAKTGKEAVDNLMAGAAGDPEAFDPLMSHTLWWYGQALQNGGLYLMSMDDKARPDNEGHYCPICEFVTHSTDFDAQVAIDSASDQMLEYARTEGLLPPLQ